MRFAVRRALCLDEQSGYFIAGGCWQRQENKRTTFFFAHKCAIEGEHMEVHVQSQSRVGSLSCSQRGGVSVRNAVETEQVFGPPFERAAELQDEGADQRGTVRCVAIKQSVA